MYCFYSETTVCNISLQGKTTSAHKNEHTTVKYAEEASCCGDAKYGAILEDIELEVEK